MVNNEYRRRGQYLGSKEFFSFVYFEFDPERGQGCLAGKEYEHLRGRQPCSNRLHKGFAGNEFLIVYYNSLFTKPVCHLMYELLIGGRVGKKGAISDRGNFRI